MKIDTEKDRALLIEIINNSQIPGRFIDDVMKLKVAILQAKIEDDKEKPQ